MIQPMNKYAFLIFHREYEAFLGELRSLGVVHVQEQKQAKEVEELQGTPLRGAPCPTPLRYGQGS